jgi:hypothetical protein
VVGMVVDESIDRLFNQDPVFVSQHTPIHVPLAE